MLRTRREFIIAATGALAGVVGTALMGAAAIPVMVDIDPAPAADKIDHAISDLQTAKAYLATPTAVATSTQPAPTATDVPPTATNVPPTATTAPPTNTPVPTPTATQPAANASGVKLVVPAFWSDTPENFTRFFAANPPSGTIMSGGFGIANHLAWYSSPNSPQGIGPGQQQTRQQSMVDRYNFAKSKGAKCLTYIGIGDMQGGYPPSNAGAYSDFNAIKGKIQLQFKLYPGETDGIFLDEYPWSGFASELSQLKTLIKSYGADKLITGNAAGWQGHDAERDNANFVDVLVVFESGAKTGKGNGPYFLNAEADNGYTQPDWFHLVPAAKVGAWTHSMSATKADINRAFDVCKQQGIGNFYGTDLGPSGYYWGAPPSDAFMQLLFARLRSATSI